MRLNSMVFSFIAIYVTLLPTSVNAADSEFNMKKYLNECGGKIYSTCNSEKLNQETIYEEAKKAALAQSKKIMVVIGADWCPACNLFSKMVSEDKNKYQLFERVVLVELNGDLSSTKTLAKKLNVTYLGYPQAFIFGPEKNDILKVFYPSTFNNVEKLVAHLDLKKAPTSVLPKPAKVGVVDVAFLESEIDQHNEYGKSTFYKSPKDNYEKYINQGIASMHAFHYLDAYRAFNMAVKTNPDRSVGYVGQIISVFNLGRRSDAQFFSDQAAMKLSALIKSKKLSAQDLAWAEYGLSFRLSNISSYDQDDLKNTKTLKKASEDIFITDKENYDGQALITWLSISVVENAKGIFENILKKENQNGGAHHYLTHISEMENDMRSARQHALVYKNLAQGSAHAQHMYGHTLPQKGDWTGAYNTFVEAHNIHIKWSKKYNVNVGLDWHYAHNLDLLAATLLGLNEIEKAKQIWYTISEHDSRAINHFLWATVVSNTYEETDVILKFYENHNEEWKNYIQPFREELELVKEKELNSNLLLHSVDKKSDLEKLILRAKQNHILKAKDNSKLSKDVVSYFGERFTKGGFDGWSNAYLELLRFKRIAKILNMNDLIKDLEPLEFTVQSGALCGGSPEKKSLTKCIE